MWSTMVGISRRPDLSVWLGNFHLADRTEMIALELLLNQRCISFLAQFGKVLYGAFIYSYSTALRIPFGCPIYHSGIFLTGDEFHKMSKHFAFYTIGIQTIQVFFHHLFSLAPDLSSRERVIPSSQWIDAELSAEVYSTRLCGTSASSYLMHS